MKTANTIRIENPSAVLVAFIENAHKQKRERMKQLREKFKKAF